MTGPKHARHDEVLSVAYLIEQGAVVVDGFAPVERAAGLLWFVLWFSLSAFLALTVGWPGVAVGLSLAGCLVSAGAVVVQRRPQHRLLDSLTGADLAGSSGVHRSSDHRPSGPDAAHLWSVVHGELDTVVGATGTPESLVNRSAGLASTATSCCRVDSVR